ncbi:membrane metallo-endopeptidase-like 1-like [Arapaima gigas]
MGKSESQTDIVERWRGAERRRRPRPRRCSAAELGLSVVLLALSCALAALLALYASALRGRSGARDTVGPGGGESAGSSNGAVLFLM